MLNVVLFTGAFFFMEFVAWSNHKYVMHGFMWRWHVDHHLHDKGKQQSRSEEVKHFEKNDLFFLTYAIPAIVLLLFGFTYQSSILISIGFGISAYGLTYFLIHDVIIHKRLPLGFLQKKHGKYMKALIRAHSAHHWGGNPRDFHNYGLLIFPFRYFKE